MVSFDESLTLLFSFCCENLFMATLCNRAGHYIFALWFLSFYLFSLPNLSGCISDVCCTSTRGVALVWSVNLECRSEMCCARLAGNARRKKSPKSLGAIAQHCQAISSQLRHVSTIGKNLLSSNISPTCRHNMVNFGPLAAEICWRDWGTPANFNGFWNFHILAALLHGILVVAVSQTLRHWTEGTICIRQGGHHVGHWPTFLVSYSFS